MRSCTRSLIIVVCALTGLVALGNCGSSDARPPAIQEAGGSGGESQGGTSGAGQAAGASGALGSADASAAGSNGTGGGAGGSEAGREAAVPCVSGAIVLEEVCNDHIDNDCNGLIDCADPACRGTGVAQYGNSCDVAATTFGKKCDWLGSCVCPGGGSSETSCSDGVDNDCDGKVDCADDDCQPGGASGSVTCDALGHTCAAVDAGGACTKCPGGQAHESNCGNGKDDDCDGKVDCDDDDCAAVQCGLASTQVCQGTKCIDLNNAYGITLTPGNAAIPADGLATDPITVVLTGVDQIADKLVALTITGVGSWYGVLAPDAGNTLTVRTDSTGTARATLLSSAGGGTATITAVIVGAQTGTTTSVIMPAIDSMSVLRTAVSLMGVRGSGYNEENQITFQLFAPNNVPYPQGLAVSFTHDSLAGSSLGPPRSTPFIGAGGLPESTTTQITGPDGTVNVTLYSGTAAGTRSIVASATAGGQTKTLTLSNLVIVGAKPNGLHFSLACNPRNLAALANTNCQSSLVDLTSTCTISAADRFGNVLGVAKSVTFSSEAGNMGPPASTPNYPDPNLGLASTNLNTLGGVLPMDVDPDPSIGEDESVPQAASDPCHFRQRNPRDGIVTVIAATQGEEGFVDLNGNGSYDLGEPFVDLPEAFVDANDNNKYDEGEAFTDFNHNGRWDPANGVWDSDTTIWTETKIVFTSAAATNLAVYSGYSQYPAYPSGNIGVLAPTTTKLVDFSFTDMNLNVLPAQPATVYSASLIFGPATAGIINAPFIRSNTEEGFVFSRLYCPVGADGGASSCQAACPPTAAFCTARSFLSSFEKRVHGTLAVTAGSPTLASDFAVDTTATTAGGFPTLRLTGTIPGAPP